MTHKERADAEIDLLSVFAAIWEGKWLVGAALLVSIAAFILSLFLFPKLPFTATAELRPISSLTADRYRAFNSVGVFEITPGVLQSQYLEELEDVRFLVQVARRHDLIDESDYGRDEEY